MNKRGLRDGVVDPTAQHYEEDFEFPLWKLIRECAEEKDISYSDAAAIVAPQYAAQTKIRDQEFTDAQIAKRESEGNKETMANDKVLAEAARVKKF